MWPLFSSLLPPASHPVPSVGPTGQPWRRVCPQESVGRTLLKRDEASGDWQPLAVWWLSSSHTEAVTVPIAEKPVRPSPEVPGGKGRLGPERVCFMLQVIQVIQGRWLLSMNNRTVTVELG